MENLPPLLEDKLNVWKEVLSEIRLEDLPIALQLFQEEVKSRYLMKALDGEEVEPKRQTDKIEI